MSLKPLSVNRLNVLMTTAIIGWLEESSRTPHLLFDMNGIDPTHPFASFVGKQGMLVLNVANQATHGNFSIDEEYVFVGGRFGGKAINGYIPLWRLKVVYSREGDFEHPLYEMDRPNEEKTAQSNAVVETLNEVQANLKPVSEEKGLEGGTVVSLADRRKKKD